MDFGIANGLDFTKAQVPDFYSIIPTKTKLILENKICGSDDAARRSSEPENGQVIA